MSDQPGQLADELTVDGLRSEMDRVSLQQALRDFEIANARVVDLTQRLIDATEEKLRLRTELEALRIEYEGLRARFDAQVNSRAYRIAELVRKLHVALRA